MKVEEIPTDEYLGASSMLSRASHSNEGHLRPRRITSHFRQPSTAPGERDVGNRCRPRRGLRHDRLFELTLYAGLSHHYPVRAESMTSTHRTVNRIVRILESVARSGDTAVSLTTLVRELEAPKSSVYGFVKRSSCAEAIPRRSPRRLHARHRRRACPRPS